MLQERTAPHPFFDITEEEWDRIMDVNAKSVMIACQVFGRAMIDAGKGGSIITISSAAAGPPLIPRIHLFRIQACRQQHDTVSCKRVRTAWCAGECHHPRLLPGGAE